MILAKKINICVIFSHPYNKDNISSYIKDMLEDYELIHPAHLE